MKRLLAILLLCSFCAVAHSAPIIIGTEAQLPFDGLMTNSMFVNWRPANGSVETVNPPVITWNYQPSETNYTTDYKIRTFTLEVSYTNFGALAFSASCDFNFYAALPCFTNAGPIYWRVKYYDTNGLEYTSAARSFTITNTPTYWNRTKLADDSYLTNRTHPYIMFTASNRAALYSTIKSNQLYDAGTYHWNYFEERATNARNALVFAGWQNATITSIGDRQTWALYMQWCAAMWQFTRDGWWITNSGAGLQPLWTNWIAYSETNNLWREDYYYMDDAWAATALGYDWLWDVLSDTDRAQTLAFINHATDYTRTNFWWDVPSISGIYTTMDWGSAMKKGAAHNFLLSQYALLGMTSAMTENTNVLAQWKRYANYMASRGYPYGVLGASTQGRDYQQAQQCYIKNAYFPLWIYFHSMLPELGWTNSVWPKKSIEYWSFNNPVGHDRLMEQWGNTGAGPFTWWGKHSVGRVLAQLAGDGNYTTHFLQQSNYNRDRWTYGVNKGMPYSNTDALETQIQPSLLPIPAPTTNLGNYYLNTADGIVISAWGPPNVSTTLDSGTWFKLVSSPAGVEMNHGYCNIGNFEMLAYGGIVTYGGSGLLGPARRTYLHYVPMPQGNCQFSSQEYMKFPWLARVMAFTNTANWRYFAADITKMVQHAETPGGQGEPVGCSVSLADANAPVGGHGRNEFVNKLHRHFVDMKRYVVIHDTMSTDGTTNIFWAFPWRVRNMGRAMTPTTNTYPVLSAGESFLHRDQEGGRDLAITTNALTGTNVYYTSGYLSGGGDLIDYGVGVSNYFRTSHGSFYYNTTNLAGDTIKVIVAAIATNNLGVHEQFGTNVLTNPLTGENTWVPGYLDGQPGAGAVCWWTNTVRSSNWCFTTVVYPVPDGGTEPTITRLDDYTVTIAEPGITTNTISFDTNQIAVANLIVDTGATNSIPPPEPPPAAYGGHTLRASQAIYFR